MPEAIARIAALGPVRLTNQALADLALQADRERREAAKRGDRQRAQELLEEVEALCALMT